jgi:hypothetical protein
MLFNTYLTVMESGLRSDGVDRGRGREKQTTIPHVFLHSICYFPFCKANLTPEAADLGYYVIGCWLHTFPRLGSMCAPPQAAFFYILSAVISAPQQHCTSAELTA